MGILVRKRVLLPAGLAVLCLAVAPRANAAEPARGDAIEDIGQDAPGGPPGSGTRMEETEPGAGDPMDPWNPERLRREQRRSDSDLEEGEAEPENALLKRGARRAECLRHLRRNSRENGKIRQGSSAQLLRRCLEAGLPNRERSRRAECALRAQSLRRESARAGRQIPEEAIMRRCLAGGKRAEHEGRAGLSWPDRPEFRRPLKR